MSDNKKPFDPHQTIEEEDDEFIEPSGPIDLTGKPHIVILTGPFSGKIFRLKEEGGTIIGRDATADIQIEDPKVSRHHAEISQNPDGHLLIKDLGSANGTFVNNNKITEYVIQEGDKLRIGKTLILKFSYQDDLESQAQEELYDKGAKDPLTGIFNRQYFLDRLAGEFSFSSRHDHPLSLMILDIDRFKTVNDTNGHPAGDFLLVNFTRVIRGLLREEDVFARYGGDEFVILLRATGLETALQVAERIRVTIDNHKFAFGGTEIHVTTSIGLVAYPNVDPVMKAEDIIKAADEQLYKAKEAGRNKISG